MTNERKVRIIKEPAVLSKIPSEQINMAIREVEEEWEKRSSDKSDKPKTSN